MQNIHYTKRQICPAIDNIKSAINNTFSYGLIFSIVLLISMTMNAQMTPLVLFDFSESKDVSCWRVVDDGVMGGVSQGNFTVDEDGYVIFSGTVSTANYGGFSSVRCDVENKDISSFKYIVLKVKGDGKKYQFRLKETSNQRHSYITTFQTSGKWEKIILPLENFYPGFRGSRLDIPNFPGNQIGQLAFLIANKTDEDFVLLVSTIWLE